MYDPTAIIGHTNRFLSFLKERYSIERICREEEEINFPLPFKVVGLCTTKFKK